MLFKDVEMAKEIMNTSNPVIQKKCGRRVKNFDADVWNKRSQVIVKEANIAKVRLSRERG